VKSIFIFFFLISIGNTIFAQIPENDQNWEVVFNQEFNSEAEFNSTFIRGWTGLNCLTHGLTNQSGCWPELQLYKNENIVLNSGKLEILIKKENVFGKMIDFSPNDLPPNHIMCDGLPNYRSFSYTSGAFRATEKYFYGYYEINCKLPKGRGFWPAFWLHADHDCGYGHEIDILEPSGAMMENAIQYGANNHGRFYDPSAINSPDHCTELADGGVVNVLPMNQAFYSYSCEWLPSSIKYYYNNNSQPVRHYRGSMVPRSPRYLNINVAIDPFDNSKPNHLTPFPSKMEIDYIRYYTLKLDCNIEVVQSNFNFATHQYSVKKLYKLSNSLVPVGGRHTLRATDYIELNSEFTVPLGAEFAIIPTDICQ